MTCEDFSQKKIFFINKNLKHSLLEINRNRMIDLDR